MNKTYTKSPVTDKNILQSFQEATTQQKILEGISFDDIYMLENSKEKFIVGQKKTTERVKNKYEDPHLQSQATYFIAPLKNGKIQKGTVISAISNEKFDWDVGERWGTHKAETSVIISKNDQKIYGFSISEYNSLDNLDCIKSAISKEKRIRDQWKYDHSLPGKATKLTRDTSKKIGKQINNFKQKSLKDKFLISAAALAPVAITAAAPEAVLATTAATAVVAGGLYGGLGVFYVGVGIVYGTRYLTESLCDKIKSFTKDVKKNGAKTVAQTKIQEIKKRMNDRKKEKAKEKKLSHGDALALLAIAEPTQTVSPNSNTMAITPQREVF